MQVSKSTAYAVIAAADGISTSKAIAYTVLSTEDKVNVAKAIGYAVLGPPLTVPGSRSLTDLARAAFKASHVPMLCFVELDFASGFVRVCNASYTFQWGGHDWLGLGNMGGIDAIQEGGDLQAYGCSLILSGIPPEYISLAFGHDYQGRPAKIWLAPLTSDYQVIADPALAFAGRMDVMNIELDATATVSVSIESRLVDWDRVRVRRFNHEDQISRYPDDMGLQYVAQMVEKNISWGRA